MPIGLLAIGSALDPARYDVRIVDARLGSMLDEARRLAESPLVDGEEDLPL
jgi:hypothetical protein